MASKTTIFARRKNLLNLVAKCNFINLDATTAHNLQFL